MLPPCIPVHTTNMSLTVKPLLERGIEKVKPGDLYLNNSPYFGNTHHADYTYIAPVFYNNELLFFTAAKGHQADCGNSIPSTYAPNARDLFEEGAIDWPCIKIQENYHDIEDILRIAQMRIRVPHQWYGDYLAGVGSARIGERRLIELCDNYGPETMKAFIRQWQEYGKEMAIAEIRKLPKGHAEYWVKHDPLPGVLPQGVTVKVKIDIDPEEGNVTIDLRDNDDPLPCGLNESEACATANARSGVLNRIDPNIPHNEGAISRINVLMRESCVGKSKWPYSSSLATTNVGDRLICCVQAALNQIFDSRGMAEGGAVQCPAVSVISGKDPRRNNEPWINQLFCGMTGGPGVKGHDGWVTYQYPCTGGALYWQTTEVMEQRFSVEVLEEEIIMDSAGAGQWDSAPACRFILAPRRDLAAPMTAAYSCDGQINRPRGALGGLTGNSSAAWKYSIDEGMETRTELSPFAEPEIRPGEAIVSESSGAGGYGNPLDRDPELVRHRVREGWTSKEKAYDIYGVVLDTEPELYKVNYEGTKKRRDELRGDDRLREELVKKWLETSWRAKRLPMNESWAQDFYKLMAEQHGEKIAQAMVKEVE
jgi:N-methylhydantoinase B